MTVLNYTSPKFNHPWRGKNEGLHTQQDNRKFYQCKACLDYYDIHRLKSLAGQWICDVCLTDLDLNGVHDVQNSKK